MPQIAVQEIITSITDVQGGINGGEVDDIGDVIHFQVLVTNPGDTALSGVTVNSSLLGSLSAPTGDTNNNGLLDLGETWTYTARAYFGLGESGGFSREFGWASL